MRAFCTRRASHCTPLARPARSRARLVRAACRARETVTAGRGLVIILVIGNMLCSEEHLHIPQVPIKTLQRRPGTARNSPSAPALLRGVAQGTPHRRQACAHTSARALGHAAPPPSMRAHREARARSPAPSPTVQRRRPPRAGFRGRVRTSAEAKMPPPPARPSFSGGRGNLNRTQGLQVKFASVWKGGFWGPQ